LPGMQPSPATRSSKDVQYDTLQRTKPCDADEQEPGWGVGQGAKPNVLARMEEPAVPCFCSHGGRRSRSSAARAFCFSKDCRGFVSSTA